MKALRAAVLLRCQRAREAARQIDAARAKREHEVACAHEAAARTTLREGEKAAEIEIAATADALGAGTIDRLRLDALLATERAALDQVKALAAAVKKSEADVAAAHARLDTANAALAVDRRATRKRQRLAEDTASIWRRGLEAAQEMEREDQFADTRRAP